MTSQKQAIVGAIMWLSGAKPLEEPLCTVQRLRWWTYTTERCAEDELAGDLSWLIAAGLVAWFMPGVLTLTPAGRRIGVDVVRKCMS